MHQYIPVQESFARWKQDPAFVAEYEALEEQVAAAMGTTQAVVARLESAGVAFDADAGAVCQGYWDAVADQLRAGAGYTIGPERLKQILRRAQDNKGDR
jgi:hypothetical protein